jgi:hypothetical protein
MRVSGRLNGRLTRLEAQVRAQDEAEQEAFVREFMAALTDEELDALTERVEQISTEEEAADFYPDEWLREWRARR